jgi:hypothetical protein
LLVVDGEERGQQGVTGGEPHRHQDPGPEIGHLDAADTELVVQPAREGDHASRHDEADDGKEPGSEADGDPIDDRPDHRLGERDHQRRRDQRHRVIEAEARDDQRQQCQQRALDDDHADESRESEVRRQDGKTARRQVTCRGDS